MKSIQNRIGYYNAALLWIVPPILLVSSYLILHIFHKPAVENRLDLLIGFVGYASLFFSAIRLSAIYLRLFEERMLAVAITALILFADPWSVVSWYYIPSLALLWAHFCILRNQPFTAFFLMTCATLFFPPLIWGLVLTFLIMLLTTDGNSLKFILKCFGGIILPLLLLASVAFLILGNDIWHFFVQFKASEIIEFSFPFDNPTLITIFTLGVGIVIILRSVQYLFSLSQRSSKESSFIIYNQLVYLFLAITLSLFFYKKESGLAMVLTAPAAGMILSRYFLGEKVSAIYKILLVVFCFAVLMGRLSYFI